VIATARRGSMRQPNDCSDYTHRLTETHLMHPIRIVTAALAALALLSAGARADEIDDVAADRMSFLREIGKRSLSRTRRSITLGPSIGVAPQVALDSNEADLQLSFGVDLLRYDIPPLPSPKRMADAIKARAKDEVARRLKAAATGGGDEPTAAERKRIAEQVWAEIKAELLLENRPRKLEKPSFALRLEVDHLVDAGSWNLRAMVGLGISKVFLSVGPGVEIDDGAALVVPIEASLPVLLTDGLRSPVVEPFLRAEVVATDRADRDDRLLLGARFLLDVL
jgi:hypothetical protein